MVKRDMQPKKLVLTATETAVANKLGITSKVYAEHKARAGQFKTVAVLSSNESVLDTINPECVKPEAPKSDPVNHPAHYKVGGIETIDFIEAKGLGYHIGNVVKYITRAGHKGTTNGLEDLKKAQWYLNRAIEKNENLTN